MYTVPVVPVGPAVPVGPGVPVGPAVPGTTGTSRKNCAHSFESVIDVKRPNKRYTEYITYFQKEG